MCQQTMLKVTEDRCHSVVAHASLAIPRPNQMKGCMHVVATIRMILNYFIFGNRTCQISSK